MRYSLFALSFIIMSMNTNIVSGSALLDESMNTEMKNRIFSKVNLTNINVNSLTQEEKEWLYETNLLKALKNLERDGYSNREDSSRTLGELAAFYEYKDRPDLANPWLVQKATLDLNEALAGDQSTLGIFNHMIKEQRLKDNDNFFSKIIKSYQLNPDTFAKGEYNTDKLDVYVNALVEAYQESGKNTLELRKRKGVPAIPLYDNVLIKIVEEMLNRK